MTEEKHYAVCLEDYACPSCCSGSSDFYGSLSEIEAFIDALSEEKLCTDTVFAFRRFTAGEVDATHGVNFHEQRLLTPVAFVSEREYALPEKRWTHSNVYGWPYEMRFGQARIVERIYRRDRKWTRCYRLAANDLSYLNDLIPKEKWEHLTGGFWGHPAILEVLETPSGYTVRNRLLIPCGDFASLEEAKADLEKRHEPPFSGFCDMVFGDG